MEIKEISNRLEKLDSATRNEIHRKVYILCSTYRDFYNNSNDKSLYPAPDKVELDMYSMLIEEEERRNGLVP